MWNRYQCGSSLPNQRPTKHPHGLKVNENFRERMHIVIEYIVSGMKLT